jgi:hypothetical protein
MSHGSHSVQNKEFVEDFEAAVRSRSSLEWRSLERLIFDPCYGTPGKGGLHVIYKLSNVIPVSARIMKFHAYEFDVTKVPDELFC